MTLLRELRRQMGMLKMLRTLRMLKMLRTLRTLKMLRMLKILNQPSPTFAKPVTSPATAATATHPPIA
jgi:hypothetical protein